MLIFERKAGQVFYIGDDIQVTILQIRSNQVKIGIDAPKHIPVHRQEIYDKIKNGEAREENVNQLGNIRR